MRRMTRRDRASAASEGRGLLEPRQVEIDAGGWFVLRARFTPNEDVGLGLENLSERDEGLGVEFRAWPCS